MGEMTWYGWDERERVRLPRRARALLSAETGLRPRRTPPASEGDVRMPPSALPSAAREALVTAVGHAHVRDDRRSRLTHAGGKGYLDLVRRRGGDATNAPDAVVLPGSHDEVLDVLRACEAHGVAVVPFGGGTSVVGGVEPVRDSFMSVIALDLGRLHALTDIDPISLTATLGPGLPAPAAESVLADRGLTLGHFPQSYAHATLGGFAATRSAGQASTGYGRFDDLVIGLRAATPRGTLDVGRAPASAAGPDLRHLLLGSEGALGVLTELTLRVQRVPEARRYEGWAFPTLAAGADALRRLVQDRLPPDVARLSDPAETRTTLAMGGSGARLMGRYLALRGRREGCLLVLGWEGTRRTVRARHAAAVRLLRDGGGITLGPSVGHSWERERFSGPYLRDALLDAGALVETLETATTWADLEELYVALRVALRIALSEQETPPLVLCHVSHVYPTGASLYFTVVAARDDADPERQWTRAKKAASDVIVAHHATITHHHGVGLDHRPWMAAEIGDLGLAALRALKGRLDPAGILNPGKLLPSG